MVPVPRLAIPHDGGSGTQSVAAIKFTAVIFILHAGVSWDNLDRARLASWTAVMRRDMVVATSLGRFSLVHLAVVRLWSWSRRVILDTCVAWIVHRRWSRRLGRHVSEPGESNA